MPLVPLLLASVLAASNPPTTKLAVMRISAVNIDEKLIGFYTEHLAEQLSQQGLRVVTPKDVETVLGLERQRQLLGCAEGTTHCMVEIASALGVDAILVTDLARIGKAFQLNLRILGASDGKRKASYSSTVPSEEGLLSELNAAASSLATQLFGGEGPAVRVATAATLRPWAWASLGAGGVLLLGSAASFAAAKSRHDQLISTTEAPSDLAKGQSLASEGQTFQTLGWIGIALGATAVAGGSALFFSSDTKPRLSVDLRPGGMTLGIAGELP